jgi:hypothetical protein
MVGLLVGWLVGLLVCWFVGLLVGWLVRSFVGLLVGWLFDCLVVWSLCPPQVCREVLYIIPADYSYKST